MFSYTHSPMKILTEAQGEVSDTQETTMHIPYRLRNAMGSSRLGIRVPEWSASTGLLSVAMIRYLRRSWNTNISVSMLRLLDFLTSFHAEQSALCIECHFRVFTQQRAKWSWSSARRRPTHILLPMPNGTWEKGLMKFLWNQRSGLNWVQPLKYSSLQPRAWLFITSTVYEQSNKDSRYKVT